MYRQSTLVDHDRSFLGVAEDSSGNSDSLEKENEFTAPEMAISLAEFLKPSNQQEPMGRSSKNVATQSKAPLKSVIDEQSIVDNELEPPKTTNFCAPSKPHWTPDCGAISLTGEIANHFSNSQEVIQASVVFGNKDGVARAVK